MTIDFQYHSHTQKKTFMKITKLMQKMTKKRLPRMNVQAKPQGGSVHAFWKAAAVINLSRKQASFAM